MHELNDALGTDYEVELRWQDMLPEPPSQPGSENGANGHNGAATLLGGDLPSEDESDFSFRSATRAYWTALTDPAWCSLVQLPL